MTRKGKRGKFSWAKLTSDCFSTTFYMSRLSFDLQKRLLPILRAGDLPQCERVVAAQLVSLPHSPFHIILDLSITTKPEAVAVWLDKFFRQQSKRFKIGAAYTEMNGFSANPDLWFCDAFAYEQHNGHEDYDWLANWQSNVSGGMTIEGLESLQAVYASGAMGNKQFSEACDTTDLLVVLKFQDLIRRATTDLQEWQFPLLATAHGFDFIYEVQRGDL
jgi:hypothetical protein